MRDREGFHFLREIERDFITYEIERDYIITRDGEVFHYLQEMQRDFITYKRCRGISLLTRIFAAGARVALFTVTFC